MAEKRKYPLHKSPRGVLIWPKLNVPDTKFKEDGEYKTDLRISVSIFESSGLKALLDEAVEDALVNATDDKGKPLAPASKAKIKAKGANFPYKIAYDKEGNELSDVIDLAFKIKSEGIDRETGKAYSCKPKQFDGKGKPIDVALNIGTEAKISFTMFPWATAALGYGVSLRPKAVQVLKLLQRGSADASAYGFEEEEDSYDYSSDDFHGDDSEDQSDYTTDDADIPF